MQRDRIAIIVFSIGLLLYVLGFILDIPSALVILALLVMLAALPIYRRSFLSASLVIGLVILLCLPGLSWLVGVWHFNDYYEHGLLIPLVSGFFAWRKRNEILRRETSWSGVIVLTGGLLMCVLGFILREPRLLALSFLVVLSALTIYFCGWKAMRAMAFPIVFLLFMIPPPFLNDLTYHLQVVAVDGSAALVKAMGIAVTVTGSQITVGDSSFVVGLPCSGMRSLISSLAVAAMLAYALNGSKIRRVILFLSAVPIAILTNILRIVTLLLVGNHYGTDTTQGLHDPLSLAVFVLAVVLLIAESLLLKLKLGDWQEAQADVTLQEKGQDD